MFDPDGNGHSMIRREGIIYSSITRGIRECVAHPAQKFDYSRSHGLNFWLKAIGGWIKQGVARRREVNLKRKVVGNPSQISVGINPHALAFNLGVHSEIHVSQLARSDMAGS